MEIGERIRSARRNAGLSQEEVARRAGMSLNGMANIERGLIPDPHISSVRRIAEALGVPVGDLLEEPVPLGNAPEAGRAGEELEPSFNDVLGEERRVRAFLAAHPSEEERVQALEKAASSIGLYNDRWRVEVNGIEKDGILPHGRSIEMRALFGFISEAMTNKGIREYTGRIDAGRLEASDKEQVAINRLSAAWVEMFNLVNCMREVERTNRESVPKDSKRGIELLEDFLSEDLEEAEKQRTTERPQAR